MMVELNGAVLVVQRTRSGVITDRARECPYCHRMTHFFENVQGRTACTGCEAVHERPRLSTQSTR